MSSKTEKLLGLIAISNNVMIGSMGVVIEQLAEFVEDKEKKQAFIQAGKELEKYGTKRTEELLSLFEHEPLSWGIQRDIDSMKKEVK